MVEKQLFSPIGKYIPDIEREHAELQYAQNSLAKGERLVQTQFNIVLFSPKREMVVAPQALMMFAATAQSVNGSSVTLVATLPLSWNRNTIAALEEFKKLRTTISVESANLVSKGLQGEKTPVLQALLFGGRKGQLIQFCPFDNTAGNYNVTVVGRSGAGKSVFMQELMASTIGLGGRVFVLDVGRSFENQRDAGPIYFFLQTQLAYLAAGSEAENASGATTFGDVEVCNSVDGSSNQWCGRQRCCTSGAGYQRIV
jgi:conjugal transfer ATP-binding protein TraC